MKKILFIFFLLVATITGINVYTVNTVLSHIPSMKAGAFNPTGGGTYYLQASISSSQSTVTLTSFTEPSSGIPYTMTYLNSDIEYGTINPTSANSEFISFTGITQNTNGTATLTGVTRGLGRSYPYTASTTLAHAAPGQTQFILSAPPQFYNEYASKRNSQVISGQWQYTTLPTSTVACTDQSQFCNKAYIDALSIVGAPTSTETTMGVSVITPASVVGIGTASTTSGAPYVIENKFATTTPGTQCTAGTWKCIVATTLGKISQSYLDLTASFTWTGAHVFNSTATFNATTTQACSGVFSAPCILNGVSYKWPTTQTASSSSLQTNNSGVLTWETTNTSYFLGATTTSAVFTTNAGVISTSTSLGTIPAGLLRTNGIYEVNVLMTSTAASGNAVSTVGLHLGNGQECTFNSGPLTSGNSTYFIRFQIMNNSSGTAQIGFVESAGGLSVASAPTAVAFAGGVCSGSVDTTVSNNVTITIANGSNVTTTITSAYATFLGSN